MIHPKRLGRNLLIPFLAFALPLAAQQITYLHDQFDNDNVGSNPNGVGDGFFTQAGQHISEDADAEILTINEGNTHNWGLTSMYTKPVDDFPAVTAPDWSTTALFGLHRMVVTSDTSGGDVNVQYGIVNTTASPGNSSGGNAHGSWQVGQGGSLWIDIRKDGDTSPLTGTLQFTDSNSPTDGAAMQAAQFTFDSYTGSSPMEAWITLDDGNGFSVGFSEAVTVSSGALSWSWADLDNDQGSNVAPHFAAGQELYTVANTSNVNTGRGFSELDYITVTAIPEPSTLFLGLAGLGVLIAGRRHRQQ